METGLIMEQYSSTSESDSITVRILIESDGINKSLICNKPSSRNADSKLICKHPSCNEDLAPGKESIPDKPSSSNDKHTHNTADQNGHSEAAIVDSELGWSKVDHKKKARKNKR